MITPCLSAEISGGETQSVRGGRGAGKHNLGAQKKTECDSHRKSPSISKVTFSDHHHVTVAHEAGEPCPPYIAGDRRFQLSLPSRVRILRVGVANETRQGRKQAAVRPALRCIEKAHGASAVSLSRSPGQSSTRSSA